jgi:hypothetical protein
MADLIGGLLGYMKDPRRTQQMQALAGLLTSANERAKGFNELNRAATDEFLQTKDIYGPKAQQLAKTLADAYNPIGLTVFHGSPAKFSKFDPTKIGSGEGAQAYGYGHYVAESPDVARRYQMGLTQAKGEEVLYKNKPLTDLYSQIENKSMKLSGKAADIENQKLQLVEHMMLDKPPQELIPYAKETGFDQSVIDWLEKDVAKNTQIPGAFYEIDLPDEQIAKMLDWYKPLSEQPNVLKVLETHPTMGKESIGWKGAPEGLWEKSMSLPSKTGEWLYREMQGNNPIETSEALRQFGIPGIRYLDEGSRGAEKGTSNFVVFPGNEGLLTILKRNNSLLDD